MQRMGVYGPITSLHPPQGPDVCLPKFLTLCRGDTATRAVIGPLIKHDRTKTGFKLCFHIAVNDTISACALKLINTNSKNPLLCSVFAFNVISLLEPTKIDYLDLECTNSCRISILFLE